MKNGDNVWEELWNELHHQGDLGEASYAAVPQLVRIAAGLTARDWNFYGLLATIEVERHRHGNPAIPGWLKPAYHQAWSEIFQLAIRDLAAESDPSTIGSILSVLALAKGHLKLGALLSSMDSSELDEWLDEQCGWTESYEE